MEAIAGAIITDICDAHLGILDSAQETSDATVRATKLFSDITGGNNYVCILAHRFTYQHYFDCKHFQIVFIFFLSLRLFLKQSVKLG